MSAAVQMTISAVSYQLSSAQRRMWLRQQSTGAERIQSVFELPQDVSEDRLRAAIEHVVREEEIFGTRLVASEFSEAPLAVVDEIPLFDWEEYGVTDFVAENALLKEESHRGEQRLRCIYVQTLETDRKQLILSAPAWFIDWWGIKNLAAKIAVAYSERDPVETMQYSAFARWEHDWMEDQRDVLAGHQYWREQHELRQRAGKMICTRQNLASNNWNWEKVIISQVLKEDLEQYAEQRGISVQEVLLSVWIVLLLRQSEGEIVAIERWEDGRPLAEMTEAVGLFGSWLPLAIDKSRISTFRELATEVSNAARTGADWAEWYQPLSTGWAHQRIGFRWRPYPTRWSKGELELSIECEQPGGYDMDLVLEAGMEPGEGLVVRTGYRQSSYAPADVEVLSGQFTNLLHCILEKDYERLSELPLLSRAERERVLKEWNQTKQEYGPEQQVQELFEQQATSAGTAIAVVCGAEQISYQELNRRANQLARYLQKQGVGSEVRVGLYVERSVEMVVSVLAVLKSGGIYIPLDPSYPPSRLNYILHDSQAAVVVACGGKIERLGTSPAKLVCLEAIREQLEHESGENLGPAGIRSNLAYLLYTSGSTGRPKGVMVSHGGLLNYLNWCRAAYRTTEAGRTPVHSPLGFDLTVTSLLGPLVGGGSVELIADEAGVDGLSNALRQAWDYTLVKLTPSHLDLLSRGSKNEPVAGRARCLVIGGEVLPAEMVRWWKKAAPQTRLINEYGPTETVVGCCVYEAGSQEEWQDGVPIGRPIANTQLYVLDDEMEPVAIGEAGELYIGGAGLARGYWDKPDLTAERFVPDPFLGSGQRLYRTGDRVRWRASGLMEYLGREDEQVKLRGYRIELGEIESALREHSGVQDAVVAMHGEGARRVLAAYIVKRSGSNVEKSELLTWVRHRLPEYMTPGRWTWLEELPLTPHGKLDRRRLPSPSENSEGDHEAHDVSEGCGAAEQVIAGIWKEVLEISRLGLDDNFFDIGGNSMLLIECHSKIQAALSADIPVIEMFNNPTVRMLARHLQASGQIVAKPDTARLERRKQAAQQQLLARRAAAQRN